MSTKQNLYVYDIETYRTCFLFAGKFYGAKEHQIFEISNRVNERSVLLSFLSYLQNCGCSMVGFNSLNFDYPIIHKLLNEPYTFTPLVAYNEAQAIISQAYGRTDHFIRLSDRIIPQIDLVKINHFDNPNKRISLKGLQVAMRSETVEDLPFDPSLDLTSEQIDLLRQYNIHDVTETEKFLSKCEHLITMRQELLDSGMLTGDVLNYSNVKIGTELLIKRIGRAKCFSGSKPRQTIRERVSIKDVVFPKIVYRTEPFEEVKEWFKQQTIYMGRKDQNPKLTKTLAGLDFYFGIGGVHASVDTSIYESNETYVIKDIDVSGMYPAVALANGLYPEHLGKEFLPPYEQLQRDRAQYPKGSTNNKTLKLAGNAVYGNSNNAYSCFYDPKYTFTTTVNGQLQLLQLTEMLSFIPGLKLIQANTDGITAYVRRDTSQFFDLWCRAWEKDTGLKLEEVDYSKMFIRDVNNYVAITTSGKVKRKGAYWYPIDDEDYEGVWNKDFSNLSAQKGVEQVLLTGCRPEDIVRLISDKFDFMLRYKTPGGAKVYIGEKEMLKTVRYYVSKTGQPMKKVSKPTGKIGDYKRKNKLTDSYYHRILSEIPEGTWDERIHNKKKTKYQMTTTSVQAGWLVKECNNAKDFNWLDVDWDFYIEEIKKLIIRR